MPKSKNAKKQEAQKLCKSSLIWPPEMNGDVLALVFEEVALFNSSRPFSIFDKEHCLGVPYLTADGRSTLLSCSAVCRAWRSEAQRHLLRSVILKETAIATFVAALKRKEVPIIPQHVTLHLPLPFRSFPSLTVNAITGIPNLQSLVLLSQKNISTTWTRMISTSVEKLSECSLFANIASFHFQIDVNVPFTTFARFLIAMPGLKNLYLNTTYIVSDGSEHQHLPRPTFRLQYLELWDEEERVFRLYDWLLGSSQNSLKTLAVYMIALPMDPGPFMDAFTMIAPSLTTLWVPNLLEYCLSDMISQCTSLIELALCVTCFRSNAALVVGSLPPTLQRLRVGDDSHSRRRSMNSQYRYTVVRKALARSLFPTSLKTIVIDLEDQPSLVEVKMQVLAMARACIPKRITVLIACPTEEQNLTEEITRQYSSGNDASREDSGVVFVDKSPRAYESDFSDSGSDFSDHEWDMHSDDLFDAGIYEDRDDSDIDNYSDDDYV